MEAKLYKFSAIDPYITDYKILPTETEVKGKNWIAWGDNNDYPNYLYDLYLNVATLHSLLNGVVSYVCGDDVKTSNDITLTDMDAKELVEDMTLSYAIYGGFALAVYRNKMKKVCKLQVLDFRFVRTDKKNKYIYYSEDFGVKSYGRAKAICYPAYDQTEQQDVSIYYYKNNKFQVYPTPVHIGAITACELEKSIDTYHLNSINNGFMGSCAFNFNNGVPEDEEQKEITNAIEEKFTGKENAGRVIVSFNDDKEHALEVTPINPTDFSDRYKSLSERSTSQIFVSWRTTPNIMGLPTETTGFSAQEYSDAFKLFNKTVIEPIQKVICGVINKCYEGVLEVTIEPFTINFESLDTNKNIINE